jgi:hypothetical protein
MATIPISKRSALTLFALTAAAAAGVLSFGSAMAKADDMKPSPWVQGPSTGEVRKDATQGDVRGGDVLAPAGGEVRQSPIAVPGTTARGFQGIRVGPPQGSW